MAGVVNTNSVVRPTITEQGPTAAARTPTTVLEAATTPYACQWCWAAFFVSLSSCLRGIPTLGALAAIFAYVAVNDPL